MASEVKAPEKLFEEIQSGKDLKHAVTADKSAPAVVNPGQLMAEIATEHKLKHVENVHDTSAPKVDGATVHHNEHNKLFTEIAGEHKLKHVENVHDTSAPVIPADAHLKENPMKNVLKEIKKDEA